MPWFRLYLKIEQTTAPVRELYANRSAGVGVVVTEIKISNYV